MDCCGKEVVLPPRLRCDNYVQAKSRQRQDTRISMFSFSSHMDMAVLRDARERGKGKRMHDLVGRRSGQQVGIDHSVSQPADCEHHHVLGFEPQSNAHILCTV
jgi:hypothetical protein